MRGLNHSSLLFTLRLISARMCRQRILHVPAPNLWPLKPIFACSTSPRIFLVGMAAFLALVGFVVLILYQADRARLQRQSRPERPHHSGVLAIGALFTFRQVIRLFREIRWVNSLTGARTGGVPRAHPACADGGDAQRRRGARGLSTITTRAILDSVATRLDEGRELSRYLVGLLVFLGLLGTFWGCWRRCIRSAGVIDSMKTGVDTTSMFDDLKQGLSAPIAGMSVSFTSSLFGLASSLILGFLDLQAGQAQNRFYSEFEEFLASHVQTTPAGEAIPDAPTIAQGAQPAIEYQRRRRGDRDARRGHSGSGRPHAHRAAANSRLGRRAGDAAGRYRQAPAAPVGRAGRAKQVWG